MVLRQGEKRGKSRAYFLTYATSLMRLGFWGNIFNFPEPNGSLATRSKDKDHLVTSVLTYISPSGWILLLQTVHESQCEQPFSSLTRCTQETFVLLRDVLNKEKPEQTYLDLKPHSQKFIKHFFFFINGWTALCKQTNRKVRLC